MNATTRPGKSSRRSTGAPASPGRPKDLAKRAAILAAAERMFVQHGFEGASMDQIATEAGVSKLTVYSHFGDKDTLFAEAVKSYCDQQMPASVFAPAPGTPLRTKLLDIASTFFTMTSAPEAISGHRLLCTPQMVGKRLARLFWEGGPQRIQNAFAGFLEHRIAAGELDIANPSVAAAQFFSLLKGDLHMRLVLGCIDENTGCPDQVREHLEASVDMFLRAWATGERPRP